MHNTDNKNIEEISDLNGLCIPTIWVEKILKQNQLYEKIKRMVTEEYDYDAIKLNNLFKTYIDKIANPC